MKSELYVNLTMVLLGLLCLHRAQGRSRRAKTVICEPGSNTFYHSQAGECLPCDKCNEGYSLIPVQEHSLRMDPVHGATNCSPCRKCPPGTYNDRRSFDVTCRTCRNCSSLVLKEESQCTDKTNAVCGDVIEISNAKELQASANEPKNKTFQGPSSPTVLLIIVMSLLASLVLFITAYVFIRRAQKQSAISQYISTEVDKTKEQDGLLCLNNSQSNVTAKSQPTGPETTNLHVPTENEETRPKEKVHTKRLVQENARNEPEIERRSAPSTYQIPESTTVKSLKPSRRSSWNTHPPELHSENPITQFTIGYTNLALSRSITCSTSDRSSERNLENESMEMLSEFTYVLD